MDQNALTEILLTIPVLLMAFVAHEWGHAYAALKQGDPTARDAGRLTFNPLVHIDPYRTIILPAVLILAGGIVVGGAKPCPVNPANFKNGARSDIIVSLAGITMNLLIAICSAVLFLLIGMLGRAIPSGESVFALLQEMMHLSVQYNALLLFLNLLPIPGFDGAHVVEHFLPPAIALQYRKYGNLSLLFLFALIYFGGSAVNTLFTPVSILQRVLMHPVLPYALALQ